MFSLHTQRLMIMWDVHRGGILNWSSGVGMYMCVEASWWHELGCELGACGVIGLGDPSEGIKAWTFSMRRKKENSLHLLTCMEISASADVEVVLPMVCGA